MTDVTTGGGAAAPAPVNPEEELRTRMRETTVATLLALRNAAVRSINLLEHAEENLARCREQLAAIEKLLAENGHVEPEVEQDVQLATAAAGIAPEPPHSAAKFFDRSVPEHPNAPAADGAA